MTIPKIPGAHRWMNSWESLISFLPNEDEACRITGKSDAESAMEALAKRVPLVAIKCGKRGSLVGKAGCCWFVPAQLVTPVDPSAPAIVSMPDSWPRTFAEKRRRSAPGLEIARLLCPPFDKAAPSLSAILHSCTSFFI